MAAGPAKILNPDTDVQAEKKWQLLKPLSVAQTAVTAAKLCQNLNDVSFAQDTIRFLNVARYGAIRFQVLGVASDGNVPVLDLYGWHASGPGAHVGKVTLAFGTHTSAASTGFHAQKDTHESIKDAFLPATAYRSCDTYTITNDYEQEMISDSAALIYQQYKSISSPGTDAGVSPVAANRPSYVNVDFARSGYEYFGVLVTALNSATTVGAIWKPLSLRRF